jgi:large subunit ribosomal protein L4
MAIAAKIRDDEVVVIDELAFSAPKTKDMAAIVRALKCDGGTLLIATAAHDKNVYMSARNIANVCISPVSDLNAWSVLKPRKLLVTRAALDVIRQRMQAPKKATAAAAS